MAALGAREVGRRDTVIKALHILNVDDDDAGRYVKSRILRQAGHRVAEAVTAAQALDAIVKELPDLLLLDVKLPDMSGFEVARRVRADPRSRRLPILQVSTICVTPEDEQDGLESGADAFLSPPFDDQALIEAVGRAVRVRRLATVARPAAKLDARTLTRVHALAKSRMAESLGVSDFAAAAKLSVFHFTRLFKATTGETPHAYLVRVRVGEGMRLLRETRLGLAEVARRAGFKTHAHFSRVFRAQAGTTPTGYRRSLPGAAQPLGAGGVANADQPSRASTPATIRSQRSPSKAKVSRKVSSTRRSSALRSRARARK